MRTDLFDYALPPELIAQTPLPRGQSRLLVLHRASGRVEHRRFPDFLDYIQPGDTLVLNDTRVTARRLIGLRENGQPAEALLIKPVGETGWEALVKPGRALKPGKQLRFVGPPPETPSVVAIVRETTPEGGRIVEFESRAERDAVASWGAVPLPPYIQTPLPTGQEDRYQTVYAAHDGSAAAPTAGLHFTPEMLAAAAAKGVQIARITLTVGVGTFRPVRSEEIEAHEMHGETFTLSEEAARVINATTGRVIAIGTTSVRTLESVGAKAEREGANARVVADSGETHLFITPGYRFRVVDALLTNFHLPRSTLLMLISALAGRDAILAAYAEAVREKYRFFSFGDAMLIV